LGIKKRKDWEVGVRGKTPLERENDVGVKTGKKGLRTKGRVLGKWLHVLQREGGWNKGKKGGKEQDRRIYLCLKGFTERQWVKGGLGGGGRSKIRRELSANCTGASFLKKKFAGVREKKGGGKKKKGSEKYENERYRFLSEISEDLGGMKRGKYRERRTKTHLGGVATPKRWGGVKENRDTYNSLQKDSRTKQWGGEETGGVRRRVMHLLG